MASNARAVFIATAAMLLACPVWAGGVSPQCAADAAWYARNNPNFVLIEAVADEHYGNSTSPQPVKPGKWNASIMGPNLAEIRESLSRNPWTLRHYLQFADSAAVRVTGGVPGVSYVATEILIKAGFVLKMNSLQQHQPGSLAYGTLRITFPITIGACLGFPAGYCPPGRECI